MLRCGVPMPWLRPREQAVRRVLGRSRLGWAERADGEAAQQRGRGRRDVACRRRGHLQQEQAAWATWATRATWIERMKCVVK